MKTNSKTIRFIKSASSDVTEHRIRFAKSGTTFSYDFPYSSIGNQMIGVRLADVVPKEMDSFQVFITAVDAAGNESDQLDCGTYRINDMAKLNTKTLRFLPSVTPDTVEHRIRIQVEGTPFSYATPFSKVAYTASAAGTGGTTPATKISVDIGGLTNVPKETGTYEVFITAADAAGNESDAFEIHGAVFDFTAPAAPTAGEIV